MCNATWVNYQGRQQHGGKTGCRPVATVDHFKSEKINTLQKLKYCRMSARIVRDHYLSAKLSPSTLYCPGSVSM